MNGYKLNSKGELIPIDVYIVWGCPGSGKTTYVKKHMEDGDLVIDLDYIKQSISLSNKTECKDNLLDIALNIRDYLYELVSKRNVDANNIWVVAGVPTQEEREQLTNKVNATKLIYIEATEQQCIDRILNDTERIDKDIQIKIIDKWFKQYNYEWYG